jgi:DNA-binding transcriptional LysR family regulator
MDGMVFEISLLRTLVVVADAGSFSRAGHSLKRTQSSVSLQIKRLEDQTGKRLFVRNGRGVRLTVEGETLFTYARRMLRLNDEAFSRLSKSGTLETVRLGIPQEFEKSHLPAVVRQFIQEHPDVLLDIAVEPALVLRQSLADREFDIILVRQEPSRGGGEMRWRESLVWVGREKQTFAEDEPIPLAVTPEPCIFRKHAVESLRRDNRSWRIVFTSTSVSSINAAVEAGMGVTVFSRSIVPESLVTLGTQQGLPDLEDAEVALMTAPAGLSECAANLARMIAGCLDLKPLANPKTQQVIRKRRKRTSADLRMARR